MYISSMAMAFCIKENVSRCCNLIEFKLERRESIPLPPTNNSEHGDQRNTVAVFSNARLQNLSGENCSGKQQAVGRSRPYSKYNTNVSEKLPKSVCSLEE
jgi:hypothetical protein